MTTWDELVVGKLYTYHHVPIHGNAAVDNIYHPLIEGDVVKLVSKNYDKWTGIDRPEARDLLVEHLTSGKGFLVFVPDDLVAYVETERNYEMTARDAMMRPEDRLKVDIEQHTRLTAYEMQELQKASDEIRIMAKENASKRSKMTTLVEEFAEAVLASRGKHDDPLELELQQIASICINLIWQIRMGVDVANLRTKR